MQPQRTPIHLGPAELNLLHADIRELEANRQIALMEVG